MSGARSGFGAATRRPRAGAADRWSARWSCGEGSTCSTARCSSSICVSSRPTARRVSACPPSCASQARRIASSSEAPRCARWRCAPTGGASPAARAIRCLLFAATCSRRRSSPPSGSCRRRTSRRCRSRAPPYRSLRRHPGCFGRPPSRGRSWTRSGRCRSRSRCGVRTPPCRVRLSRARRAT